MIIFYSEIYEAIVDWMSVEDGSDVLDAGCGAGGVTSLIASGVGEIGRVTAFDVDDDVLAVAQDALSGTKYKSRVVFRKADVSCLPFPDNYFDLAWCSRMIHHIEDQVGVVKEIHRVLKPGGKLFLREGGLRPRFLPTDIGLGSPGLEDRLNAQSNEWFSGHIRPSHDSVAYHFGWTQMLKDCGFTDISARSFLLEFLSPFDKNQVDFVTQQLAIWLEDEDREHMLSVDDKNTLQMILNPGSSHYAFNRPDLHYREAITVYYGQA